MDIVTATINLPFWTLTLVSFAYTLAIATTQQAKQEEIDLTVERNRVLRRAELAEAELQQERDKLLIRSTNRHCCWSSAVPW